MAKIEYEALDLNEIANEATRANTDPRQKRTNKDYFFLEKDGFSLLRFLPKMKGTRFYQETRIHGVQAGENKRQFHCTRVLTKKPDGKTVWMPPQDGPDCVFCKYYNHLWQKGDRLTGKAKEDMQNSARKLRPYERYYYNVIAREYIDPQTKKVVKNAGPLILSMGKELHAKIMTAMVGDAQHGIKKLGDISHPLTGRDFRYVKKTTTGSGGMQYATYELSTFEDVCPCGTEDEMEEWMGKLHDLAALRKLSDEATMTRALKVHLGVLPPSDDEFDYSQFEGGPAGDGDDADYSVAELSRKADTVSARVDDTPPPAKKPLVKQDKVEKSPVAAASPGKGAALDLAADPEFMAELDKLDNE